VSGERGNRKSTTGIVVSTKMDKTIRVQTQQLRKHPMYGKYVRRTKCYFAHDEKSEAKNGDLVEIAQTRPLSKLKRWRLVRVVRQVAD